MPFATAEQEWPCRWRIFLSLIFLSFSSLLSVVQPADAMQVPRTVLIIFGVLLGLVAGAVLFSHDGSRATPSQTPARQTEPEPLPRERRPRVLLEAQFARRSRRDLERGGVHRFAVYNAGDAALRLARGPTGNRMAVRELPVEIESRSLGYIAVAWSPLEAGLHAPWSGSATIYTNDPELKAFDLIVAEDASEADDGAMR